MKSGTIRGLLGAAIVAGFSISAFAEIKENPYQVIIDRNPFNLRPIPPPPPPPTETNAPAEPPPEVKLTGITTLLGTPKVFLQLEDKKTKKPSFPPPMAAGDSEDGITIVSIDTENLKVRIKNGDAETTLDFKNNGVKPGGAAVASVAGIPPPGVMPLKPAVPPAIPGVPTAQAGAANTGRAIVAGGAPSTAAYNPAAANPYAGVVPPRPVRSDNNLAIVAGGGSQIYNPNAQTPTPPPSYNRQEAEAIMELTRQRLQQQEQSGKVAPGQPPSALIPPTALGRALGTPTPPPPGFPNPTGQQ